MAAPFKFTLCVHLLFNSVYPVIEIMSILQYKELDVKLEESGRELGKIRVTPGTRHTTLFRNIKDNKINLRVGAILIIKLVDPNDDDALVISDTWTVCLPRGLTRDLTVKGNKLNASIRFTFDKFPETHDVTLSIVTITVSPASSVKSSLGSSHDPAEPASKKPRTDLSSSPAGSSTDSPQPPPVTTSQDNLKTLRLLVQQFAADQLVHDAASHEMLPIVHKAFKRWFKLHGSGFKYCVTNVDGFLSDAFIIAYDGQGKKRLLACKLIETTSTPVNFTPSSASSSVPHITPPSVPATSPAVNTNPKKPKAMKQTLMSDFDKNLAKNTKTLTGTNKNLARTDKNLARTDKNLARTDKNLERTNRTLEKTLNQLTTIHNDLQRQRQ